MDHVGQVMLTKELEASVVGLPQNCDVFIGWNPNSNSDVGWLTLKKGVNRDFKHLQLRDYNLNNLVNVSDKEVEKETVVDSSEGCITATFPVNKVSCVHEEELVSDVFNDKVQDVSTPVEKMTNPVKKVVEKSEVKERENVPLRVEMSKGNASTACIYCNRSIKNKETHEAKCLSKNAKYTDRVECPICSYRVLRRGLTSHLKIHEYETRNCSNCGIPVKEDGYNIHLLKCRERYNRRHLILCPFCKKSFGSAFSLSKHVQALHPNLPPSSNEPVIKYSESAAVKQDRSLKILEESKNKGILISEVVDCGIGQKATSEDLFGVQDFSVKDTEGVNIGGDVPPVWNENFEVVCRLKFEMEVAGRVNKKTIKTRMSNGVEKSMKKFTKHVGHNFEDLEFKSNDTVLSGEELAGSIDKGLIQVGLISFDDKEGNELEVSNDPTPASNFEELRKDYYDEMRSDWFKTPPLFHHSTPAQSDTLSNTPEVNEDFAVLDSVSVGFSEGGTDTEDNMDIDGEVVGNTEHVVDFSMF